MSTIIRFKRKLSGGNGEIKLLPGEPFFNLTDKHFYIGNEDGTLQDVAGIKINSVADDVVDFNVGIDHYQKTINNVANVSETVGNRKIDEIFEPNSPIVKTSSVSNRAHDVTNLSLKNSDGATVKLTWGTADNPHEDSFTVNAGSISGVIKQAEDVTTTINNKKISDIFETDGVTAKKATTATKLSSTNVGSAKHPVYFNNYGKPAQTTYSLDVATDKDYGLIKLGSSTTGNQRSVMKADDGDAYVDVTDLAADTKSNKEKITACEKLLTWETF